MKRVRRWLLILIVLPMLVCLLAAGISAWSNRSLPVQSRETQRLADVEQARLEEAVHLRQSLGNRVWAGWGDMDIPIVVYNEEYAFLAGFGGPPPAGWATVPHGQARGSAWELILSGEVLGHPSYRLSLPDPTKTPENFIVRIGDRYVASMQTWEFAEVNFYTQFRDELPGFLQPVIPYGLVWKFLFGATETYISGLEHESFHAYQAQRVPERLAQAERAAPLEDQYPWEDDVSETAWKEELRLLVQAAKAETDAEAADLARQFLAQRSSRRTTTRLSEKLVDYERQREWLEGLAKYSELELVRLAATTPEYIPLPAITNDPGFKNYSDREQFYQQQIEEAGRTAGRSGEVRFYYSGMAQAVLLDRLSPGWKDQVLEGEAWLEDLLAAALEAP